jgi:hypothetical protein
MTQRRVDQWGRAEGIEGTISSETLFDLFHLKPQSGTESLIIIERANAERFQPPGETNETKFYLSIVERIIMAEWKTPNQR